LVCIDMNTPGYNCVCDPGTVVPQRLLCVPRCGIYDTGVSSDTRFEGYACGPTVAGDPFPCPDE
jgi:hypothetical protein